ncbi:MAG: ribulose-phosphate 3-epimerase [Proteobacteria bacterium]|nr:ribulose-phosphate 3-epimerase [Pseudomonadota bacterium]
MPSSKDILIAPSLLSADFACLGEEVRKLEAGRADWLHFDVMDGRFVPNLSVGVPVLKSLRRVTALPIDVHLMIVEPDSLLGAFAKAGADTLTVQVEACTHLHRTLQNIHALGCRAGVSLNPHTPVDCLDYVGDLVDFVLVMTVNPGFGGQSYIDACTKKIAEIRRRMPDVCIEVDGGIKADTVERASAAGANIFVSGSGVFSQPDYGAAIKELRRLAAQARRVP